MTDAPRRPEDAGLAPVSAPRRLAHWLTALLVVLIWAFGGIEGDQLTEGLLRLRTLFHEVAGELVFALLAARLLLRILEPPGPPFFHGLAGVIAAVGHTVLYALLAAVPVTGVVALFAGGEPLALFGLVDIPSPWPANRELARYAGDLHNSLAEALLLLAGLHAFVAFVRHFTMKDQALSRLLPQPFRASRAAGRKASDS